MNFSNYTKETFTPKLIDLYNKRWKAKKKSQKAFAKAMNALYEKYDIRDRSGKEQRICTHQQVSQWLNGTFPDDENLRCICEVLGEKPEYFTSATETELYKFSQTFMTDVGEDKILPFCEKIGLDPQFLLTLSNMFGESLGDQFPFWTPIRNNPNWLDFDNPYMRPDPLNFWSSSAKMDTDVKMFQINAKNEEGTEKLLTLSGVDILFLRDVQNEVVNYVEYLFHKRKKELRDECDEASHRAMKPNPNGGTSIIRLSFDEIKTIDKYFNEYADIMSKEGEERREEDGDDQGTRKREV